MLLPPTVAKYFFIKFYHSRTIIIGCLNFNFRCNISTTPTLNDTTFSLALFLLSWFHRQLQTAFWFRWPAVVTCRLGRKVGHLHLFETSVPRSSRPSSPPPYPSDIRCRNSPSHVSVYVYASWKFNIKFMAYQNSFTISKLCKCLNRFTLKNEIKIGRIIVYIISINIWNWKENQKVFGMR